MNRTRAPRSFLNPSSLISGPVTVRSLRCMHMDTPIHMAKFCPNLLRGYPSGLQLCPYTVRLIIRGSHADPRSHLVKVLRGSGCLDVLQGGPRLRPSTSSGLQGRPLRACGAQGRSSGFLGVRMLLPLSYSDLDQLGFPSSPALESSPGSIDSLKVGTAPHGVAVSHVPRPPALPLVVTV